MTKKKFNRNLNYFVPVVKKYWTCSSEDENLKRLLNYLDSQKKIAIWSVNKCNVLYGGVFAD